MNNPFSRNKLLIDTEIHCHILPTIGCDPEFTEQALSVLKVFEYFGVNTVFATPHIRLSRPSNTKKNILARADEFKESIEKKSLKIKFNVVAEYYIDNGIHEIIEKKDFLTYPGNYVLLELPMRKKPNNFETIIQKIVDYGYKPIIGHPELHHYLRYDWEQIERLREMGCFFQLNLIDMTGFFGEEVIAASINLLRSKTFDFVGTGAHSTGEMKLITENLLQNKNCVDILNSVRFNNKIFSLENSFLDSISNEIEKKVEHIKSNKLWNFFK